MRNCPARLREMAVVVRITSYRRIPVGQPGTFKESFRLYDYGGDILRLVGANEVGMRASRPCQRGITFCLEPRCSHCPIPLFRFRIPIQTVDLYEITQR
jgi:hypothetical protein